MKTIPTLETKRLVLRPFADHDASEVQRLAGDKEVADTTTNIPHPYTEEMAEEWISKHKDEFSREEGVTFAITKKTKDSVIGAISLMKISKFHQAELGYWIGKSYWNNGFCSEAAQAVIQYAFTELSLVRIHAFHMSRNPSSGRVMQKLSMQHEGSRKLHLRKKDKLEDIELYGILKEEWIKTANN